MSNSPDVIIVAPHTAGGVPSSYTEQCAAAVCSFDPIEISQKEKEEKENEKKKNEKRGK